MRESHAGGNNSLYPVKNLAGGQELMFQVMTWGLFFPSAAWAHDGFIPLIGAQGLILPVATCIFLRSGHVSHRRSSWKLRFACLVSFPLSVASTLLTFKTHSPHVVLFFVIPISAHLLLVAGALWWAPRTQRR